MRDTLNQSEYRRLNVPKAVEKRLGITADEYRAKQDAGEKWCTGCKDWHPLGAFWADATRVDGLQEKCRGYRKACRANKKEK